MAKATPEKKTTAKKPAAKKPAAKKPTKAPATPEAIEVVETPAPISPEVKSKEDHDDLKMLNKLHALFSLQQIDTQVTKIRSVRGLLPVEIKDLEDTVAGLETRIKNFDEDISNSEEVVTARNLAIKEALALIKKYESQKDNVKNNREYESLTNQILNQELDIKLFEKEIRNVKEKLELKKRSRENVVNDLELYKHELEIKVNELDEIIAETTKEEKQLEEKALEFHKLIDERLLIAYNRIRTNAKNGLAVVTVERNACGGCFNKIPPQRQLDIKTQKKIIVCEYCGRILVDPALFTEQAD